MVKFSFLALAAAAATIGAASASSSPSVVKKNIKLGNRNLRRGDPATEALLKKAIPYKRQLLHPILRVYGCQALR